MSGEKLAAMWPETWESRGIIRFGCERATMSRPMLRVAMAVCDDVTCNGFFRDCRLGREVGDDRRKKETGVCRVQAGRSN
jgi:hypothetical protein